MSQFPNSPQPAGSLAPRSSRWQHLLPVLVVLLSLLATSWVGATAAAAAPSNVSDHHRGDDKLTTADRVAAMLANAAYQDVTAAEAAGYATSIDTLGCFQSPGRGAMGVHYINAARLDATVDITQPEALVYELDASGRITGLVAHEYIVPVDKWTSSKPPKLFGMEFHRHPTLPLWVLHA
jgi:hypothetical protein